MLKCNNIYQVTVYYLMLFTLVVMCGCSVNRSTDSAILGPKSSNIPYGSRAGKCQPYPQKEPVNILGVKGAKITNERYSVRGNKDYTVLGKNYVVWRDMDSYVEEGIASWYGPGFNNQKTSNGEIYRMNGYSAAHKNLPLPSFLKVTNLSNGKTVIVRVNDRGPFHGNRILDLSKGAAQELDIIKSGTAKVRVEFINRDHLISEQTTIAEMNGFKPFIQVFSTNSKTKATEIINKIKQHSNINSFIEQKGNIYRVKVGPLSQSNAQSTLATIKKMGYSKAFFSAQ